MMLGTPISRLAGLQEARRGGENGVPGSLEGAHMALTNETFTLSAYFVLLLLPG